MKRHKARMKRPELIVSDFDGTLKKVHAGLSPKLRASIRKFVDQGGKFVIATARPLFALEGHLKGAEFIRYLILCNGSQVFDRKTRRFLFRRPFPRSVLRFIVERFWRDSRYIIMVIGAKDTMINRPWSKPPLAKYLRQIKAKVADEKTALSALKRGYEVFNIEVGAANTDLEDFKRTVRRGSAVSANFRISWDGFMEIYPADVSKGSSLGLLARRLMIPLSATLAFGDADNDIDLFDHSGRGVAVGNATRNLKKRADQVIGPYDRDSVAEFITRQVLKD